MAVQPWYVIFNDTTGELISVGSVVRERVDDGQGGSRLETAQEARTRINQNGWQIRTVTGRPDENMVWDVATKDFIAPPPRLTPAQKVATRAEYAAIMAKLTAPEQQILVNLINEANN